MNGCPDISADNPASAHPHGRFSSIGSIATDSTLDEADKHFVDTGPSWQPKTPEFRVLVHSPSKRTSGLTSAYTVYSVTSSFPLDRVKSTEPSEPSVLFGSSPATLITVQRRFTHFSVLHTVLSRRLPGLALPPLPEKQYTGRFSADFIEARRVDLEQYINRIVRHPVARYAEVVTSFLGCEDELVSNAAKKTGYNVLEYKLNFNEGMETSNSALSVNACRRAILFCPCLSSCLQY